MKNVKRKLILISVFLFFIPAIVSASQLFPPEMPVLFYGNVKNNNEPASVGTFILVKKEIDNIAIASSTTKNIGEYFIEVLCQKYIGENIFFVVNDLISGQSQCVDVSTVPSVMLDLTINNTDAILPVIILNGGDMNIYRDTSFTDPGATALDNLDGDISGDIVVAGDTVDTGATSTYSITYNVSDSSGNPAAEATRTVTVLPVEEEQVVIAADMDISSSSQEILIGDNASATSNINVPSDAINVKLNLSAVMDGTDATLNTSLNINLETSVGDVNVQIPAGTKISGEAGWTGEINLPQVQENSSVSVTPDSGNTAEVNSVIEIGFGDILLTFDQAVRILIFGQAGRDAGYSRGGSFTAITSTCSADTQVAGDALSVGGDCKIDVGDDLVIWTKHFTKFITYTQTAIPTPTGSVPIYLLKNTATGFAPEEEAEIILVPVEGGVEVLGIEADYRVIQLEKILDEASYINAGDANLAVDKIGLKRNAELETAGYNKYVASLMVGVDGLDQSSIYALTNFIVYGSETTKILGVGERAGVLNSYKAAFNKLPTTASEWQDVIKIANGRWPTERSEEAEIRAKEKFRDVYLREPDMNNPNDNAAVTIIAYGLRPDDKNLDSERKAINIFKAIFNYNPNSTTDWDMVRAIAYSGATR